MKEKMNKFGERFKGNLRRRRKKNEEVWVGAEAVWGLEMSIVFRIFI